MEWMFLPLKRYAEFNGRSRRMEYWMFQLLWVILTVIFITILLVVGIGAAGLASTGSNGALGGMMGMFASMGIMFVVFIIIALALFIPTLAVQIRRLHDTDRSGWWVMLYYGPYLVLLLVQLATIGQAGTGDSSMGLAIIAGLVSLGFYGGWITLAVFDCLPGTPGPNRFGPDPLGGAGDLSRTFQ